MSDVADRGTYRPEPIDTAHVPLPADILELRELLARNTHEVWARQRMSEGWTYGPERNDGRREHPSLVPYEDLPDAEKEYDRQTAMEALKAIVALGYRIQPPKAADSRRNPDIVE